MDKKDYKILNELVINSRIPIAKLARKAGLSREVASYRLNNLIKEKEVLGFYAVIDTEALGFSRYTCFLQLKNVNKEKENWFVGYLVNHDFVTYLGTAIGKWNIVFDLLARNLNHLEEINKEIIGKINDYLESYSVISIGSEQEYFPTKILGIKKELKYKKPEKTDVDKIDIKILELMAKDSRIEYKEISKELNLTGNAIKYRINNLEKSGIIKGYSIAIDIRKFNYEWNNLQIKVSLNKKESELKSFLREHKSVIYFYKYLGNENWDIDIGVIAKNSLELREFILELREKFGDIVKIHDIYIVDEELKGNYAPAGIFKNS